jgi:hypothetical protein
VVWSTTTNPTVELNPKTTQGAKIVTGAFTSDIVGLSPGITYYVKAYATNSSSTVYGDEVSFTTSSSPAITFTSANSGALSFDLIFNAAGTFYIDWGNGLEAQTATVSLTTYSTAFYSAGNIVRVFGSGITGLNVSTKELSSLDVSACTSLFVLYCSSNKLTTLDVSGNTSLSILNCGNNQLSALDISKNTALVVLGCYNNQLTALDVSTNTALTALWCISNQLTTLDVSANTKLDAFQCSDNKLNYISLPQAKSDYTSYTYAPQANLAASVNGIEVDLSSQLTARDESGATQTTVYKWYTKTSNTLLIQGTDYSEKDGVFAFLKTPSDSVYCTMENAAFPDLTGADVLRTGSFCHHLNLREQWQFILLA